MVSKSTMDCHVSCILCHLAVLQCFLLYHASFRSLSLSGFRLSPKSISPWLWSLVPFLPFSRSYESRSPFL